MGTLVCVAVWAPTGMFRVTWGTLKGCQNWPEQGFGGKRTVAGLLDFLPMSNVEDISPPICCCSSHGAISEENTKFIFNF